MLKCRNCGAEERNKAGKPGGVQRYKWKKLWLSPQRSDPSLEKNSWNEDFCDWAVPRV